MGYIDDAFNTISDNKLEILSKNLDRYFKLYIKPYLTSSEINSLNKYINTYSFDISQYLVDHKKFDRNVEKHIRNIEKALDASSIPAPLTVYRGTSISYLESSTIKTNNIYTLETFYSTSIDPETALFFADTKKDRALMEIEMSDEAKGMWMNKFASIKYEYELLLPKGTSLELISTTEELYKDKTYQYMKMKVK